MAAAARGAGSLRPPRAAAGNSRPPLSADRSNELSRSCTANGIAPLLCMAGFFHAPIRPIQVIRPAAMDTRRVESCCSPEESPMALALNKKNGREKNGRNNAHANGNGNTNGNTNGHGRGHVHLMDLNHVSPEKGVGILIDRALELRASDLYLATNE